MRRILIASAIAAAGVSGSASADLVSEVRLGVMQENVCVLDCDNANKEPGQSINGDLLFTSPHFLKVIWSPKPYIMGSTSLQGDTSFGGFGLAGMALAWYYHGGTMRLAYRGLGELAVAIAYGPLVVCGTYFVQTGMLSAPLLHVSCALGLLVAAFLWINQFPDYRADRAAFAVKLLISTRRRVSSRAAGRCDSAEDCRMEGVIVEWRLCRDGRA